MRPGVEEKDSGAFPGLSIQHVTGSAKTVPLSPLDEQGGEQHFSCRMMEMFVE
jgi:hypothetical protein